MGRDASVLGNYALAKGTEYIGNYFFGPIGGFVGKALGSTIAKNISRSGNEKSLPLMRSFFSKAVAEQNAREATKWVRRQKLYETSSEVLGEEVSDVNSNNQRGNLYN